VSSGSADDAGTDDASTTSRTDPLFEGARRQDLPDRHTVDERVGSFDPPDPEDVDRDASGRLTISTLPDAVSPHYDSARQARLMANRPRQWPRVLAGLLMLAAGALAAFLFLDLDTFGGGDDEPAEEQPSTTVARATSTAPASAPPAFGELTYGPPVVVSAPTAGTLATIGVVGDARGRGETVAAIDGQPVIAMFGSAPFEGVLEPGVAGAQVRQLQANLVALGVATPDELPVTGEYDQPTARAVEAWEATLGLEPTGIVPAGRLLAMPGPGVFDGALPAETQVAVGDPVGSLEVATAHTDLVQPGGGTVTGLLAPGTPIAHGDVVMQLEGTPVVAVTNGSPVDAAIIEAMASGDNQVLEQALAFFGFDPDGVMVIDGEGDLATIAAVNRWRLASGFGEAFAIGPQFYLQMPRDSVVATIYVPDGGAIAPGTLVYTVTSSTARVEADVAVAEADDLSLGRTVALETADGSSIEAVVVGIGERSGGGDGATVPVELDPVGEVPATAIGPVRRPADEG
jgi:peptidoglycan hydrolase-like protein with peptidoglycan-binding domain